MFKADAEIVCIGRGTPIEPSRADLEALLRYICLYHQLVKTDGTPSYRQLGRRAGYSEAVVYSMLRRRTPPRTQTLEAIARHAPVPGLEPLDLFVAAGLVHDPAQQRVVAAKVARARRYNAGDRSVRLDGPEPLTAVVAQGHSPGRRALEQLVEQLSEQEVHAVIQAFVGLRALCRLGEGHAASA